MILLYVCVLGEAEQVFFFVEEHAKLEGQTDTSSACCVKVCRDVAFVLWSWWAVHFHFTCLQWRTREVLPIFLKSVLMILFLPLSFFLTSWTPGQWSSMVLWKWLIRMEKQKYCVWAIVLVFLQQWTKNTWRESWGRRWTTARYKPGPLLVQ